MTDTAEELREESQAIQPQRVQPTTVRVLPDRPPTPYDLMSQAIANNAPIEYLQKLYDLAEKVRQEESKREFYDALSGFQGECPIINKGSKADRYQYASLGEIKAVISPLLAKYRLSYHWEQRMTPEGERVFCVVHHASGYTHESSVPLVIDSKMAVNDTQKGGSANTYAERYSLKGALGIVDGKDDDGKAAGNRDGSNDANRNQQRGRSESDRHGHGGDQYDPDQAATNPVAYAGQAEQRAQQSGAVAVPSDPMERIAQFQSTEDAPVTVDQIQSLLDFAADVPESQTDRNGVLNLLTPKSAGGKGIPFKLVEGRIADAHKAKCGPTCKHLRVYFDLPNDGEEEGGSSHPDGELRGDEPSLHQHEATDTVEVVPPPDPPDDAPEGQLFPTDGEQKKCCPTCGRASTIHKIPRAKGYECYTSQKGCGAKGFEPVLRVPDETGNSWRDV